MELKPSRSVEGEVGVYAVARIAKGTVLTRDAEDGGKDIILSEEERVKLSPALQERIRNFSVKRGAGYLVPEGMDYNELSTSWYFNHSCEPNLGFNTDGEFVALRDIEPGEELTYDYGMIEAEPFSMECRCGAKSCRKHIAGSDYKNPAFRAKYAHYLYPDLR